MLRIDQLILQINGRQLWPEINLDLPPGKRIALLGPNGCGKTTLLRAIMGVSGGQVSTGAIRFRGQSIENLNISDRAQSGIGLLHQRPPAVGGLTLRVLAREMGGDEESIAEYARILKLTELLDRPLNQNFSGGELKRSEVFQLFVQDADLLLLDEPESGVDMPTVKLLGQALDKYLEADRSALIVTHTGAILDYLPADEAYVLLPDTGLAGPFQPAQALANIQRFGYQYSNSIPAYAH